MEAKAAVKYAVVDTFTGEPFKGNPAAVCLLSDEISADVEWMQSVAMEFNLPITAFLSRATSTFDSDKPRFHLRWFTPACEVNLCGHGTLAAAHFLSTSGIAKSDAIEFVTNSGSLMAKKILELKDCGTSRVKQSGSEENLSIELDFHAVPLTEWDPSEVLSIPKTLKGASVINVKKTATDGDLIVELASGQVVFDIEPDFDELRICAGRAIIVTGAAPAGSRFDFFSRVFAPKLGVNEDQVTGSVYCALAPYWSKKLGKHNLIAYQASPRGGILDLQWEEQTQRVRIKGQANTIMLGTLLV